MVRAFIAVELDSNLRTAISSLQAQVKDELTKELRKSAPDARLQWVKPESIHLTLKFLGDIREEQISDIQGALTMSLRTESCFLLQIAGMGVFPDLRAPRVLWVGLEPTTPSSPTLRLAKAVETAMTTLEFPPESKPFTAHLTIARIKERGREIGRAMSDIGLLAKGHPLGTLSVRAVSLMKSDLQPSGARYTRLCEITLDPLG